MTSRASVSFVFLVVQPFFLFLSTSTSSFISVRTMAQPGAAPAGAPPAPAPAAPAPAAAQAPALPVRPAPVANTPFLPTTFSGADGEDITTWLAHFGHCGVANGWTPQRNRDVLLVRLQGAALQFVLALPNLARLTFAQISQHLVGRFAPAGNVALRRAEFRSRRRQPAEPLAAFGAAIAHLCRMAYPQLPHQVQSELSRDQFVEGLDTRELRLRVSEGDPANLDDAIGRAIRLEAIYAADHQHHEPAIVASAGPVSSVAANSSDTATMLDTLISQMAALTAAVGAAPALSLERPSAESAPYRPARPVPAPRGVSGTTGSPLPFAGQCFRCGKTGHRQRDCQLAPRPAPRSRSWQGPGSSGNGSWRGYGPPRQDFRK